MADEQENKDLAKVFEVPKIEGASRRQYDLHKADKIVGVLCEMVGCERDELVSSVFYLVDENNRLRKGLDKPPTS